MAQIRHLFGRTITWRYIPAADGEEFTAYSLVSARLYYPNYPSADQQNNIGTGHLQEALSWVLVNEEGTGPAEYEVTFQAVSDPFTTNQNPYERYYVVVNYKTQAGSAALHDVELLPIYRSDGFTSKIRVSAQDVYDLDSSVEDMATSQLWTEAKIETAIRVVEQRIEALGTLKARVFNWEKLNSCVLMLSLSYCCLSLASDASPFWFQKAKHWREESDRMFNGSAYGVNPYGTDDAEPTVKVTTGAVAPLR